MAIRTPITPIRRPRRGLDERLALAAPWLLRAVMAAVTRRPAGSRLRTATLIRAQQVGWESNNRLDHESNFLPFHPDYEFAFDGDTLQLGPDIKPSYRGHTEVREMLDLWRSGFDSFRFVPRELIDPGGPVMAARCDQVARTGELEVDRPMWAIWWFESGLIARQQVFLEEEPFRAELGRVAGEPARTTVEPAQRPRRTVGERLLLALPARLAQPAFGRIQRLGRHSPPRREGLVWASQVGWEAINRQDWDVGFRFFHRDYEFSFDDDPRGVPPGIARHHVGHSAVRSAIEEWQDGFAELRFEPRELLDPGGNAVIVQVEQVGRGSAGMEVRLTFWTVYRMKDGLIARQHIFFEEALALEELRRG